MEPKQYFISKLEEKLNINNDTKILDLGSGQSRNWISLLKKYPTLHYTGVEPQKKEADVAKDLLKDFQNAKIYNQLAHEFDGQGEFDICISLSVLEHVKQLEKFIANSVKSVKQGGIIIHRYDLGHALYSSSIKEKFQIFLGNHFPKVLPEKKFVRYLDEKDVRKMLEDNGAQVEKTTYSQMPNHKKLLKLIKFDNKNKSNAMKKVFDWEDEIFEFLVDIDKKQRELLFPTITIWSRKK